MEPLWNPMAEEQALARVHRLGQKNPVVTYRYIVKNSIEQVSQNSKCGIEGFMTSYSSF